MATEEASPKATRRLYHFLSLQHALTDIALSRIRVSRFHELNDPYELLAANVGPPAVRKAVLANREKIDSNRGIVCFTKEYKRPILWSHYADKHRGVCLGFDVSAEHAMDIKYVKERIPLIDELGRPADEDAIAEMYTSKDEDWSYEGEVRMHVDLAGLPMEGGHYFLPFRPGVELREVLLGPRCQIPLQTMRDLVNRIHTEVSVCKTDLAFKWFAVVPLKE